MPEAVGGGRKVIEQFEYSLCKDTHVNVLLCMSPDGMLCGSGCCFDNREEVEHLCSPTLNLLCSFVN